VPADQLECSEEQQARWILASILDWHRREEKAVWWELFRLADLSAEDLLDDRAGLSASLLCSRPAALPRVRRSQASNITSTFQMELRHG